MRYRSGKKNSCIKMLLQLNLKEIWTLLPHQGCYSVSLFLSVWFFSMQCVLMVSFKLATMCQTKRICQLPNVKVITKKKKEIESFLQTFLLLLSSKFLSYSNTTTQYSVGMSFQLAYISGVCFIEYIHIHEFMIASSIFF